MDIAIHRILLLSLFLHLTFVTAKAQQNSPIVLSGDRTIIYIDRLPLRGDENLMDVLLMYPELLVSGFDNLLDGYQLRMENVVMSCDICQFLSSTPAKACTKIQVCENPGVSKGKTGLGGVIDISMRHNTNGVHGMVNLEAATSADVYPRASINYGRADSLGYSTDIYANTSLSIYYPHDVFGMKQYSDIHLNQHFGSRDKLLVYLRQSYERSASISSKQDYLARARYFHTFNSIGTELLLVTGYQHGDDKASSEFNQLQCLNHTKKGSQIYMVELNTPFFLKGLQLMAGWEMDIANHRYHLIQDMVVSQMPFDEVDYYSVMNNDIYLQFDYIFGPVKLSLGDRFAFYHYGMNAHNGTASRNTNRNFIMASVAASPAEGHQLQAGYYRRFINPDYLMALPTYYPLQDGITWSNTSTLANEQKADVVRLAYTFTHKNVNTNIGTKYIRMIGDESHIIQANVAASWINNWLILSGGANLCHNITSNGTVSYGSIRLSPTFRLPQHWRISAQLIWHSLNSPSRVLTGTAVYGLLAIEKCIDNILNISLLWHDMFDNSLSSVVFAAKIIF